MPRWLDKILGNDRAEILDAKRLYALIRTQSRRPQFYGADKVPDSYDGRVDSLTLHMAIILHRLRDFGEQGARLSQALYDVMVDDFDTALREESLSDTAVSHRIKPIMRLFYTRAKLYTEALDNDVEAVKSVLSSGPIGESSDGFLNQLAHYVVAFAQTLQDMSLGDIAMTEFSAPDFT